MGVGQLKNTPYKYTPDLKARVRRYVLAYSLLGYYTREQVRRLVAGKLGLTALTVKYIVEGPV